MRYPDPQKFTLFMHIPRDFHCDNAFPVRSRWVHHATRNYMVMAFVVSFLEGTMCFETIETHVVFQGYRFDPFQWSKIAADLFQKPWRLSIDG